MLLMLKSSRPRPDQIDPQTVVLTAMKTLHFNTFYSHTSSRDANQPFSSFKTCAHKNKSEAPVVFPMKTL